MLKRVDRVLLAVRDRAAAVETFGDILGATAVREEESRVLSAKRTVVQAGVSEFELLEPTGPGPAADFLDRWGEGILAIGFASDNLNALGSHLTERSVRWQDEAGQLHIGPEETHGMRVVLSPDAQRTPVGLIQWLYEVTNVVGSHQAAAKRYADIFALDPSRFHSIASELYGYTGQLLLFDPPQRLDRIELAEITDPSRPMGRFAARRGECIYMAYVEAAAVRPLVQQLERRGARYAGRSDDPEPEGIFIHPSALHGMLLGVSRTNLAWQWSGRPELARP